MPIKDYFVLFVKNHFVHYDVYNIMIFLSLRGKLVKQNVIIVICII